MNNLPAYLDFELNISDFDRDTYTVVVRSDAGEVRERAKFPYTESELENQLLKLENAILRSTESHRTSQLQRTDTVESFGRMLFNFVLPGEARSLYNECMREATHRHRGVRLKLSVHTPRLATLPWEFLYDPRKRDYICLNPYTPLVRYTELPQTAPPLTIRSPLRILGLLSDPEDMIMRLEVEQERERVSAAIQPLVGRGLVELSWLEANHWRDLQRIMRSPTDEWHIFHFIGHGGYDQARNEGYIVLGNDDGTSHYLYASQLARLLARQQSSLRLVLLNACDGARAGLQNALSSTAATLINSGIPAVLAMQYEITNDAAIEFANAFYEALAENLPVDAAVAEARNAISLNDAHSLEWGVPVLHMRSADGRLFSVTDTDEYNDPDIGPAMSIRPQQKPTQPPQVISPHRQQAESVHPVTVTPTFVSEAELTSTLSLAIAERHAGSTLPAESTAPTAEWREVIETVDSLDATVVAEASDRIQQAGNPSAVDALPVALRPTVQTLPPALTTTSVADIDTSIIAADRLPVDAVAACDEWTEDFAEEFEEEITYAAVTPDDGLHAVKAALDERNRIFTSAVDPLDVSSLLHTYAQRQHTLIGFDWITIPAGEFLMGSNPTDDVHMFEDEAPQFKLYLDEFRIAQVPITNSQYKLFIAATGYAAPSHWQNNEIPAGEETHPVVHVNWHDAIAFCEWAGVRLPTESEWEKAARGPDGRLFPWGDQLPDSTRCNFDLAVGSVLPVGSFPAGASPYGVYDMAGNIWEWTASVWLDSYENYLEQLEKHTHMALRRVLRGGGFRDIEFVRCASRSWDLPNQRYRDLGFRVVAP